MHRRLILMSRGDFWPGITPWTVWDLRYYEWLGYSAAYDQRLEAMTKG